MNLISDNIKFLAEAKNISLASIAEGIGVSKVGFYKMLNNSDFKVSTLQKIAKVLAVPVASLLEDSKFRHFVNQGFVEVPIVPSQESTMTRYYEYVLHVSDDKFFFLEDHLRSIIYDHERLSKEEIVAKISEGIAHADSKQNYIRILKKKDDRP